VSVADTCEGWAGGWGTRGKRGAALVLVGYRRDGVCVSNGRNLLVKGVRAGFCRGPGAKRAVMQKGGDGMCGESLGLGLGEGYIGSEGGAGSFRGST